MSLDKGELAATIHIARNLSERVSPLEKTAFDHNKQIAAIHSHLREREIELQKKLAAYEKLLVDHARQIQTLKTQVAGLKRST